MNKKKLEEKFMRIWFAKKREILCILPNRIDIGIIDEKYHDVTIFFIGSNKVQIGSTASGIWNDMICDIEMITNDSDYHSERVSRVQACDDFVEEMIAKIYNLNKIKLKHGVFTKSQFV